MKIVVATAPWCANCKTLKSQLEARKLEFEEVDVDKDMDFARKIKARSLPTTVILDSGGNVIKTFTGLAVIDEIVEVLKGYN